ncbi:PREDICTED: uncharacterized protein LOC106809236 [Priapulus caudatus]|uniref:Centrosomal protein kizuna n=1 Tax=Priapulus caudatus TaxID=37621 RepID=A0ABM1E6A5_PRICU|nr:PREDICTED: uncharacterized protein LOC106809236 [Priapulus caudatus]
MSSNVTTRHASASKSAKLRAEKLRAYWNKLCDDERKSRAYNEQLLRDFDRVESELNVLAARTDRLRLLKKQYEEQLECLYPKWIEKLKAYYEQQTAHDERPAEPAIPRGMFAPPAAAFGADMNNASLAFSTLHSSDLNTHFESPPPGASARSHAASVHPHRISPASLDTSSSYASESRATQTAREAAATAWGPLAAAAAPPFSFSPAAGTAMHPPPFPFSPPAAAGAGFPPPCIVVYPYGVAASAGFSPDAPPSSLDRAPPSDPGRPRAVSIDEESPPRRRRPGGAAVAGGPVDSSTPLRSREVVRRRSEVDAEPGGRAAMTAAVRRESAAETAVRRESAAAAVRRESAGAAAWRESAGAAVRRESAGAGAARGESAAAAAAAAVSHLASDMSLSNSNLTTVSDATFTSTPSITERLSEILGLIVAGVAPSGGAPDLPTRPSDAPDGRFDPQEGESRSGIRRADGSGGGGSSQKPPRPPLPNATVAPPRGAADRSRDSLESVDDGIRRMIMDEAARCPDHHANAGRDSATPPLPSLPREEPGRGSLPLSSTGKCASPASSSGAGSQESTPRRRKTAPPGRPPPPALLSPTRASSNNDPRPPRSEVGLSKEASQRAIRAQSPLSEVSIPTHSTEPQRNKGGGRGGGGVVQRKPSRPPPPRGSSVGERSSDGDGERGARPDVAQAAQGVDKRASSSVGERPRSEEAEEGLAARELPLLGRETEEPVVDASFGDDGVSSEDSRPPVPTPRRKKLKHAGSTDLSPIVDPPARGGEEGSQSGIVTRSRVISSSSEEEKVVDKPADHESKGDSQKVFSEHEPRSSLSDELYDSPESILIEEEQQLAAVDETIEWQEKESTADAEWQEKESTADAEWQEKESAAEDGEAYVSSWDDYFALLQYIQEELMSTDLDHGTVYRGRNPTHADVTSLLAWLDTRQGEAIDVTLSSMVAEASLPFLVRSLEGRCLLPERMFEADIELFTELDVRAYVDAADLGVWDRLYSHFLQLLKCGAMEPHEIACVFAGSLIDEDSPSADKASTYSAMSSPIVIRRRLCHEPHLFSIAPRSVLIVNGVYVLPSMLWIAHEVSEYHSGPVQVNGQPPTAEVPNSANEEQDGEEEDEEEEEEEDDESREDSFFDSSPPLVDNTPLSKTLAYQSMLGGRDSRSRSKTSENENSGVDGDADDDDDGDDIENMLMPTMLSPESVSVSRTPVPAAAEASLGVGADRDGYHGNVSPAKAEYSRSAREMPSEATRVTAAAGKPKKHSFLHLDSDSDVEFPEKQITREEEGDFDFFDQ